MPHPDEHLEPDEQGGTPVLSYALPRDADEVTVAKYPDELEAQLVVGTLASRGVRARVARLRPIEVRVPAEQERQALALLDDLRLRAERLRLSRRCPDCKLAGIDAASPARRIVGVALILAGVAAVFVWPPLAVVLIAVGVGAAVFAVRDEVLRCPNCRRTLHPLRDDPAARTAGGSHG